MAGTQPGANHSLNDVQEQLFSLSQIMNKYHKILSALVILLTAFAFSSCSWVKDDTDDCPNGIWLQMQYDYNMLDVDAVKQIGRAHV